MKNLAGSSKICKDLTKIFKDEDLHRILERSSKVLQRFFTLTIPPNTIFKEMSRIFQRSCQDPHIDSYEDPLKDP